MTQRSSLKPSIVFTIISAIFWIPLYAQNPTLDQNFFIESRVRVPEKKTQLQLEDLPVSQVNRTIQYFDGLGRALQTVQWQSSPSLRDLITPITYDNFGREDKKYLPFAAKIDLSNGSFREAAFSDQESFYMSPSDWEAPGVVTIPKGMAVSKRIYEGSSLNRVLEQGFPGAVWQPSTSRTESTGRTSVIAYGSNTGGTEVRLWEVLPAGGASTSQYYAPNRLYKMISKDENWLGGKAGTVEEFKNLDGLVILKRIWETESISHSTYYVYDDFRRLRYVIPPAVTVNAFTESTIDEPFNQFIFAYHYDGKKRLIEKKLPGKGWEFFLYNKLDQVVGSQDALQREKSPQEWTVTKYDVLGRAILTGVFSHSGSPGNTSYRELFQEIVNAETVLWEERVSTGNGYSGLSIPQNDITTTLTLNYYDDYLIPGLPAVAPYNLASSYSQMTNSLPTVSRINVLGTSQMLWKVNYYDDKGQIVRSVQQHYKGGEFRDDNYDDITYTYLFSGEVSTSRRRHYVNGVEKLFVDNRFTFDHVGRAKDNYQKTGDEIGTMNSEILLHRNSYNEIGQLMGKDLHRNDLQASTFAQTVTYTYNERGWLKSQNSPLFNQNLKYNELIVGASAQFNGNISRQECGGKYYNYNYDPLNRLKSGLSSDANHEKSIVYDLMGNIQGMQRYSSGVLVDQLKYNYSGNKLTSVIDTNTNNLALYQLSGTTVYSYDVNGNTISRTNGVDNRNNITSLTYNYLNLPSTMTVGGNLVTYTYDATGVKLSKSIGSGIFNEYIGGVEYENGVLKYLQTSGGRVVRNNAADYSYEYTLSDHLGNGRLYFDTNSGGARKIQETDYYPFGLSIQRSLFGAENKYQYNGKELQDELRQYDYGARFYDPVIGRFNTVDPLAEISRKHSPYSYALNNPIRYIDVDGMYAGEVGNYKRGDKDFDDVAAYFGIKVDQRSSEDVSVNQESNKSSDFLSDEQSDTPAQDSDGPGGKGKKDPMKGGSQKKRDSDIKQYPKEFQNWYHKEIKPSVHPGRNATKEELQEGYQDWLDQGKPAAKIVEIKLPSHDRGIRAKISNITGLTGTALTIYLIISEGSRLFPPRNLIPIP